MAEDPFDEIDDDHSDREGDPFDRLDGPDDATGERPTTEGGTESAGDESNPPADQDTSGTVDPDPPATADSRRSDPFEYFGEGDDRPGPQAGAGADRDADGGHGSGPDGGEAAGPDGVPGRNVDVVADPFGDVDVSRGDPFESADSPFRQVDIDRVDPDAVWARFTEGADPAEAAEPAGEAEASLGGEDVPEDASDVVTVPKGRFCQTCPHFSDPPEATCGHEGTELLTFVGTGEVRVSNCPVVRERRELGETFE